VGKEGLRLRRIGQFQCAKDEAQRFEGRSHGPIQNNPREPV
jgi:hypothetical protein